MSFSADLLFLAAVLCCLYWVYMATGTRWLVLGVVALGAVHWALAQAGIYPDAHTFPAPQMAPLGPILLASTFIGPTRTCRPSPGPIPCHANYPCLPRSA